MEEEIVSNRSSVCPSFCLTFPGLNHKKNSRPGNLERTEVEPEERSLSSGNDSSSYRSPSDGIVKPLEQEMDSVSFSPDRAS